MKQNQDHTGGSPKNKDDMALASLLVDIVNTPEVRHVLTQVSREWVKNWCKNSILKQGMGMPVRWALSKILTVSGTDDLPGVFEKPEHMEALAQELPRMIKAMGPIFLSVVHAVEALPPERKKSLFSSFFPGQKTAVPGQVLPSLSRIAEAIYKDDPVFFSSRILPVLENLIASTDFGELRSLFDLMKTDLETVLSDGTGLIFEYPAKLITLLSLVPDGVNLLLTLTNHLLGHITALPPDIFTDLLLSLFKQVDETVIGQGLNNANEVIRQIHTGSTLIGDMDAPRFTTDLKDKLRKIMAQIDPGLAIKARGALIDGRETLISALIDMAEDHPDVLNLWLKQLSVKRNSNIRLLKRKISVMETLPNDDVVEALSAGLSSWNAYDLAEVVNALSRMINRIHHFNPGVIQALVTEFVNSLDLYELEESMGWLSRDLGQAVRPVFRMVAPSIVREICGFFTPGEDDDGYDEAMNQTRDLLSRLIQKKENS
ncbi:MAG: hypothetical protein KKD44_15575 [Proteobacteria bacterium]|nr:hypothetical protein [Pseudomonadota bacterium]